MIRAILLALVILLAPAIGLAQDSGNKKAVREKNQWSVGGGIGFAAGVNTAGGPTQFLFQVDALYSLTNNISIGPTFQLGAASNSSTVALSLDGRFYIPFGKGDGFIGKLAPYAGAGIGFRSNTGVSGDTGFLFPILFGVEYDLMDNISLSTDMRLNIVSGNDNFYYTWQIIGARLRF
jgi:hypothetical protein